MTIKKFMPYFLILLSVVGVGAFLLNQNNDESEAVYAGNCLILNNKGELYFQHAGILCDFFPDGRFLAYQKELSAKSIKKLFYFDRNHSLVWDKEIDIHHDLKIANDGQSILTLNYDVHTFQGKKVRFDVVSRLDLTKGDTINFWNSFNEHENLSKIKDCPSTFDKLIETEEIGLYEISHFNSVYEIPKNSLGQKYSWAREGNIIVSMYGLGLVGFFSPDLKLLQTTPLNDDCLSVFHDVQMLPNGHLLFFRNKKNIEDKYSEIAEFDMETRKIIWSHGVPFSEIGGSVQLLPNKHYLISETSHGGRVFEMDRYGKIYWNFTNPIMVPEINIPAHFQSIKLRQDLQFFTRLEKP